MNRRTKRIEIRLTEEEYSKITEKSANYSSKGHYIRCALVEFSDVDARKRIEMIQTLSEYYRDYRNQLSWAGSNLNQAVKRANELSVAGLLSASYIKDFLLPVISDTMNSIDSLKRNLEALTKHTLKNLDRRIKSNDDKSKIETADVESSD